MSSSVTVRNATTGKELAHRSLTIKKSLDEICHTLEMEIAQTERLKVHKHDRVQVIYNNPLLKDEGRTRFVTNVLIDEITAIAESGRHALTVIGRSPARDIIDSTWSDIYGDQTLYEITKKIAGRFNIDCQYMPTDTPDPTDTVLDFQFENESPWAKIITEADSQGFLFTSNEAGGLYLWRVASGLRGEGFHLTEGINVKNIQWKENGAQQFHEYAVCGAGEQISVIDPACKSNRILTINMTDPLIPKTKLKRRAETEMRRRKENRTTVTVPGWGLSDGQIKKLDISAWKEIFWNPNFLIPVKMPSLGLNANLLISEVEYMEDDKSMAANLTLVNREAYL